MTCPFPHNLFLQGLTYDTEKRQRLEWAGSGLQLVGAAGDLPGSPVPGGENGSTFDSSTRRLVLQGWSRFGSKTVVVGPPFYSFSIILPPNSISQDGSSCPGCMVVVGKHLNPFLLVEVEWLKSNHLTAEMLFFGVYMLRFCSFSEKGFLFCLSFDCVCVLLVFWFEDSCWHLYWGCCCSVFGVLLIFVANRQ